MTDTVAEIMDLADVLALAVWQHETDNTLASVDVKNARAALESSLRKLVEEMDGLARALERAQGAEADLANMTIRAERAQAEAAALRKFYEGVRDFESWWTNSNADYLTRQAVASIAAKEEKQG